jgi:hypothetical protein
MNDFFDSEIITEIGTLLILFLYAFFILYLLLDREISNKKFKLKFLLIILVAYYIIAIKIFAISQGLAVMSMLNFMISGIVDETIRNNEKLCNNKAELGIKSVRFFCLTSLFVFGSLILIMASNSRVNTMTFQDLFKNGFISEEIVINDFPDKFITYRNNERIYKSINCGSMTIEECQVYRSNYIWNYKYDR